MKDASDTTNDGDDGLSCICNSQEEADGHLGTCPRRPPAPERRVRVIERARAATTSLRERNVMTYGEWARIADAIDLLAGSESVLDWTKPVPSREATRVDHASGSNLAVMASCWLCDNTNDDAVLVSNAHVRASLAKLLGEVAEASSEACASSTDARNASQSWQRALDGRPNPSCCSMPGDYCDECKATLWRQWRAAFDEGSSLSVTEEERKP